jgi:nitroimidazol reductase NimA-like FMN-containing flavoprotein (pyridoxamine 5'-phosphate oxidase superfamily)
MPDELNTASEISSTTTASGRSVAQCIFDLVTSEPFAVLCTQADGEPYGSVVAFAFAVDLKSFVFGTPRETRKYRLLTQCDRVALVVDSRDQYPGELNKIEAVTMTGRAQQVEPGSDYVEAAQLLVARHPYLKSFVENPLTALFRIDAAHFLYVTRFQEVYHWTLDTDG